MTERLSGWGRTRPTSATLMRPRGPEHVHEAIAGGGTSSSVIARGAGRSYGDAAQNKDGVVLDMTALRGAPKLDPLRAEVRVAAGTSFAELLLELAHSRLTLPVVPGTRHLTVGGAIAADVHGKNHPLAGSFARHLQSIELCTPGQGTVEASRDHDRDLFEATIGGMGLTGVIAAATLKVAPMRTSYSLARIDRASSIENALETMADAGEYSHTIAWIDLLARGGSFGRGIVTRSREADETSGARSTTLSALDAARALAGRRGPERSDSAPFSSKPVVSVPQGFPTTLLRTSTVRAFNKLHWHATPAGGCERLLRMSSQLFPLDTVGDWNRLYGGQGLVQYQFAVPSGGEWLLRRVPELLRRRRLPMYLAVLKRFGRPSEGLLSFPLEGWTMAIDLPAAAPGLEQGLAEADRLLAAEGGRVYLAKDSRMHPQAMAAMYPSLPRFREVCDRADPQRRLSSDMERRLELRG